MHRHACLPSLSFLPLATVLAVLFFSGVSSSALTLTSTNLFSLTPNATFSDEGWVACQEADLAGMMEDDLYMVAGVASLSGTYGGDVWVLAKESIRFTGQARNQLRAFASHIECSGTIRKSFIAAGNSITLTTDSIMQADCVLVANTIDYKGTTSNDLFVAGNSVTIQGHIGGDLYVAGPDISIMPAAVIDGNLYFSADEDLILAPQVQLGGVVERKSFPFGPKPSTPQDQGLQLARNFVGSMGLGLLLLWFFPRTTGHAVRTLRTRAPACLLLGSGLLLLLPFLVVLSMTSAWLRPCYLAVTALSGTLVIIARIITAILVGSLVLRRRGPQGFRPVLTTLAVGLLLLYLVGLIPIVSWSVWLASVALGCGAWMYTLIQSEKETIVPPVLPDRSSAGEQVEQGQK